jgi:CheY-like chemotaxis protein
MNSETLAQSRPNGSAPVRVLLADLDESLPEMYREPLFREGFELVTAVNGLECLDRLRECVPDVLVLEPRILWGGGDGVLAMMGEDPDLAIIPVMVLTTCRNAYALNSVARFPISDYHVKPLPPDRLAGRLRSLLDHPGLHFTLGDHNGRLECAIARRTGDRVRNLRVEMFDGRIMVCGCCESHHVKQLALAAVLEAFEASESILGSIELDIKVGGDGQSTVPAMCFNSKEKRDAP